MVHACEPWGPRPQPPLIGLNYDNADAAAVGDAEDELAKVEVRFIRVAAGTSREAVWHMLGIRLFAGGNRSGPANAQPASAILPCQGASNFSHSGPDSASPVKCRGESSFLAGSGQK